MISPVLERKQALRREVHERLKAMTDSQQVGASVRARALLQLQPPWQSASSVLLFAPLPGEPDVWPLLSEALASGKKVALPRFAAETAGYQACEVREPEYDVGPGRWGIREPRPHCAKHTLIQFDLILVPGTAFDLRGHRLGRGKGYYDRLLATVDGTTCGVAFDEQIVPEVPVEPHDIVLNCLLTPTRWLEF